MINICRLTRYCAEEKDMQDHITDAVMFLEPSGDSVAAGSEKFSLVTSSVNHHVLKFEHIMI